MRKNLLYLFVIWVTFANGQVWRYSQGHYWEYGVHKRTIVLYSLCADKVIVELQTNKIKNIEYKKPRSIGQGYHVFNDPTILCQDGADQDVEVIIKNGVRTTITVK